MPDPDYLLEAMYQQWCNIMKMYKLFEKHKPVMLYDIQEERIYAYPYADFCKEMSEKSQKSLTEQYEDAVRENKMVVFVRDNDNKRLVSYLMDLK